MNFKLTKAPLLYKVTILFIMSVTYSIQEHITLSSPSASCLSVGENTVEGLPRSLAAGLLVIYKQQGIR